MEEMETQMDEFNVNPEELEASIAGMDSDSIDEFSSTMDFEKFIVLNKKELANFCRLVDPLTKASIDEYGKSVFVTCIDTDTVELRYFNNPYVVCSRVSNKSGKQVKNFAVSISNLKRIVASAFASIILVEDKDEINLALCESLLYLETKKLKESQYSFDRVPAENLIDKELAGYTFRKMGSLLSCVDRASEKVVVIKDNYANFSTGIFASKTKSPFVESPDFVLYKQVSDILGVLSDISKVTLKWSIVENTLYLDCDGTIYCALPIGVGEKVNDFVSTAQNYILNFDATISVINDTFLRLVSVVKTLDYLSDILTISFSEDKFKLTITTSSQTKSSVYEFPIVEGKPEITGDMKLTAGVLQTFLQVVGTDVKYSFNQNGLGIKNEIGNFLIRKS